MEATVAQDINTAYTQMRELITRQAATFKRMYGGEFEELVSVANEAFVKRHHDFFAGRTAIKDDYQAAIRLFIWDAMLSKTRKRLRRKEITQMISIDGMENSVGRQPQVSVMCDLSKDAAHVAKMIMDAPEAFGGHLSIGAVQTHLRALGWPYKRIWAACNEIKSVLREN